MFDRNYSLLNREVDVFELLLFLKIIEEIKFKNGLCYGVKKLVGCEFETFPDDEIVYRYSIKYEGKYQELHNNGQLYKECYYKNGKLEGKSQKWYYSGQLANECYYKNGEREGKYQSWHDNGQLKEEFYYKNG